MRLFASMLMLVVLSSAAPASAQVGAGSDEGTIDIAQQLVDALRRAENSFLYGEFEAVVSELAPLLLPSPPPADASRLVRGYTLLGVSAQFQGDDDMADAAYLEALRLDPIFRLDPLMFPPDVIERFEQVRERNRDELEALMTPSQLRPTIYVVERIEEQPLVVSMMPLGVGFLTTERYAAGIGYLVTQLATGTTMTGLYLANEYGRNRDGSFDDAPRARRRGTAQRAMAGALVALVTANVLHGGLTHASTRRVSYRTVSEPPAPDLAPAQPRSRMSVRFLPIFAP